MLIYILSHLSYCYHTLLFITKLTMYPFSKIDLLREMGADFILLKTQPEFCRLALSIWQNMPFGIVLWCIRNMLPHFADNSLANIMGKGAEGSTLSPANISMVLYIINRWIGNWLTKLTSIPVKILKKISKRRRSCEHLETNKAIARSHLVWATKRKEGLGVTW